jgi:hypothetical protein
MALVIPAGSIEMSSPYVSPWNLWLSPESVRFIYIKSYRNSHTVFLVRKYTFRGRSVETIKAFMNRVFSLSSPAPSDNARRYFRVHPLPVS